MWEKGEDISMELFTDVLMSRLRKDKIVRKISLCANLVKQFFYRTKCKMLKLKKMHIMKFRNPNFVYGDYK